jgi:hypothetical protein
MTPAQISLVLLVPDRFRSSAADSEGGYRGENENAKSDFNVHVSSPAVDSNESLPSHSHFFSLFIQPSGHYSGGGVK